MKLLIVSPMPPQLHAPGAIPLVLQAQLTGLADRGHQITMVTVAGPDSSELAALECMRESGIEVHAICRKLLYGRERWQRRIRFALSWLRGRYPWRTIWFSEPAIQRLLDSLLAKETFDLVTVEDNAMGIYRYNTAAPVIFTEYEVRKPRRVAWQGWSKGHPLHWIYSELDWLRWPAYQRMVWRRFQHIQVFTARDAELMRGLAPEVAGWLSINPFGVVLPPVADYTLEEDDHIVFVGNFTHPPNVEAALWLGREIMPRLRQLRPAVRLSLVGIYPPPQVRSLGEEYDYIEVTGAVPQVEPYLEGAALVVGPVKTGGGQRMKVLHSMAMGKAVVTTSRGVQGLVMGEEQPPLRVADTTQGLVREIAELLADPACRQSLGRQAREFVEKHYSPEAYALRLEEIYLKVIAER